MKREEQIKKIARYFSVLSNEIDHLNSLNLYDINIVAETFFAHLLNLIFDLNLVNINNIAKNATAIDLVDKAKGVCIQVTSENTSGKIKETIKSYLNVKLYTTYPTLQFMFLKEKKAYKTTFDTKGLFVFDYVSNVFDTKDLCKVINTLSEEKVDSIYEYLNSQLSLDGTIKTHFSNEVETIIDLIELISRESSASGEIDTFVDPTFKIDTRFKKYADQIRSAFADLYSVYGSTAQEISDSVITDKAKEIKIRIFLQDISIKMLGISKNDPLEALENLIGYFEDKLSASGKKYDRAAIKFYLVTETIKCNVFPNVVS